MNKFFRALIAGYGAKKLGGGCFSTILIFIVIYWALGTCNRSPQPARSTGMNTPALNKPATSGINHNSVTLVRSSGMLIVI